MDIKYQQQMHDGARTLEQQLYLVTKDAKEMAEAATALLTHIGSNHGPYHKDLLIRVQATNRRIMETDIFMAGVNSE